MPIAGGSEEAWADPCSPSCDGEDITEYIYDSMTRCHCGGCVWGDLMKTTYSNTKTRTCEGVLPPECQEKGESACVVIMPGDPPAEKCWIVEWICTIGLCIEDKPDDPDCPGCDLQKVHVCNSISGPVLSETGCPS